MDQPYLNSEGSLTLGKAVSVENVVDTNTWGQNVLGTFKSRRKTSIVPVGTELVLSLLRQ